MFIKHKNVMNIQKDRNYFIWVGHLFLETEVSSPFAIMAAEELDQNRQHGLNVKTDTDDFYLQGRPCELSSFSFIPKQRVNPAERTVFNSTKPVNFQD